VRTFRVQYGGGVIPRLHNQANIEQTSSWLVQLTKASSSSQLHCENWV